MDPSALLGFGLLTFSSMDVVTRTRNVNHLLRLTVAIALGHDAAYDGPSFHPVCP